MKVDLYFSFRSPYSYLILPRIVLLRDKHGVDINFKQVYPLAIREPEFFKGKNLFTYFLLKRFDYFLQSKNIIQSQLSDFFFASIISENGQILAFEKPGDHWVFGLNFDLINSELPKGFDNILEVFLHKCIE